MAKQLRRIGRTALLLIALQALAHQQITTAQTVKSEVSGASQVSKSEEIVLQGSKPEWAIAGADLGPVDGSEEVRHLTLYLSRSPEREAAFQQMLLAQQTPYDPRYHNWYSPVELGRQFGAGDAEIQAVTSWLEESGLRVLTVSNSKMFIEFSGNITALSSAFGVSFHWFRDTSRNRWSITSDPTMPRRFAPFVRSISGLSMEQVYTTLKRGNPVPALTDCTGNDCAHYITPMDFATIYKIAPVHAKGINGSGRVVAVIGEAAIDPADVTAFNAVTEANVPQPTVTVPPNGVNPGPPITVPPSPECTATTNTPTCNLLNMQEEATLDIERAGSVAPGAALQLIVSADTNGDPGILAATQYAVDSGTKDVPDVITISFYNCESSSRLTTENNWNELFEQGAAEGVSIFVSSGDSDATCAEPKFATPTEQDQSLSVNLYCASSSITCVGGTEFNDTGSMQYWSKSNGTGFESALGYIPEGAWNDPLRTSDGVKSYYVEGSGGGVSQYLPAPPWQAAVNPELGRALPDVAFSSSCHDGYLVCMESDGDSYNCALNSSGLPHGGSFCGTSAAAPSMAGIMALLDQANNGRQGNVNPALYALATDPSTFVFNDITVGSSGVTNCDIYTASMCNNTSPSASSLTGGTLGYALESGFDEVTGWGSINVQNLISSWKPAPSLSANPQTISISGPGGAGSTVLSIVGFPTDNVTLSCTNIPLYSLCSFGRVTADNTLTLSISTNIAELDGDKSTLQYPPTALCLIGMWIVALPRRSRRLRHKLGLLWVPGWFAALLGFANLMGCNMHTITPRGVTPITVTATAGSLSASTQLQLVVQ